MKKFICLLGVMLLAFAVFIPRAQAKTHTYSESEIKLIARVVCAEGCHQPFLGKAAIALVVMNRYESGKYGKTLKRVTRRGQFVKARKADKKCMEAVRWAIENRVMPANTYYFQRSKQLTWGGRPKIKRYCRIEAHSFYTLGKPASLTLNQYIDKSGKLVAAS